MPETILLNSKQLHKYLQNFFADRKPHKVSEIRDTLKREGKNVSHGQLAGLIYRLAQSGELISIGNGVYQLPPDTASNMIAEAAPSYLTSRLPQKPLGKSSIGVCKQQPRSPFIQPDQYPRFGCRQSNL